MNLRASLLGGAAFAALIATPAFAGDAPAPAPRDAAAAQDTTSAGTGASDKDEILVTARHRSESSQAVPLAISVVGGDHLDNTGSFNVGRLQQLTPTLQFYSSNPRNSAANIRGLGAPFGLTNDGIEQGVGIYVDDVYYSRAASSTFDFLDVQQIEVLRGPQGTLYGKNTTAGAISITSRQPTFELEGRGEVSVGNYGFKQAKAAVSGPLSDTVAARIAVSETSRNGTVWNTKTNVADDTQDNLGLRAQILWRPSSRVDVTLAGDWNRQNPICCSTVYYSYGPTQKAASRQFPALAAALGYTPASTNPYARVTDLDSPLAALNKSGGVSLRVKAQLGDGTLTSITAWRFWDWSPSNDRDYTGLPITTLSQNPSQQNQYTQEVRYNLEKRHYDVQVGVFAFNQAIHTEGTQQQGSAASTYLLSSSQISAACPSGSAAGCSTAILNGLTSNNDIRLNNTSLALYGQATWHVTDRFSIQPGVRLNYDKKIGWYNATVTNGSGQSVYFGAPTSGSAAAATLSDQLGVLAPQQFAPRFSAWNFSYDITGTYRVTQDVRFYATYAKSFKSGGINLNGVPADSTGAPILADATVKPESVHHLEAGLKTQFLDRRATLNLAAFRTTIENYQATVNDYQVGAVRGYLANAQKVRTQGVEADASWRPSARFNVYGNGAFTDARYISFTNAPCPPELSGGTYVTGTQTPSAPGTAGGLSPQACDISGQRMPGISKWAYSWGGEYNVPSKLFGKDGEVYFGYDGSYRSSFSSNPSPSAYTWVAGYSLHNLRAGFRVEHGLDIFAWVRNVANKGYVQQLTVTSGNTGLIVAQLGDPRTFGGTLKVQF
jgi:iron complex outermembrane recepter protein